MSLFTGSVGPVISNT